MNSSFTSILRIFCVFTAAACIVFQGAAAVLYVDVNSVNPVPPYADWSTAAATIQDAVDASQAGDVILVNDGAYQEGGRLANGGSLTNRVLINKAVTVESVNGPAVTAIAAYQPPGTGTGTNAVRCVYLADGAKLIGFTIENGGTRQEVGAYLDAEANGGGIWCGSTNAVVSDCLIVSNSCSVYGAGIYSGTVDNCEVDWNAIYSATSFGAGAVADSVVADSTIASNYFSHPGGEFGAGAYACTLSNCVINGNLNGGVNHSSLIDCTVENNVNSSGPYNGGGAEQSILTGCTISGNYAGGYGGGAYDCVLNYCVVSNNSAANSGGGVYYDNFQTNAPGENNTLIGNWSAYSGGGLYLGFGHGTNWSISGWTFATNSAVHDGGGLYLLSVSSSVGNCSFLGNSAGGNGGGFCPASVPANPMVMPNCTFSGNIAGGFGGGAYGVMLNNCLVTGNRAANGGGVYGGAYNSIINGNTATNGGGLLFYGGATTGIALTNCEFTNNFAVNGGAVSDGIFSNCVFSENSALTNGGAVFNAALSDCLVISNQARFGGGACASAGMLISYPRSQAGYIRTKFIGNSATADGAGIYSGTLPIIGTNSLLLGNSAAGNGGGVFGGTFGGGVVCTNSALNGGGSYNAGLSHCLIFSNTAAGNGGGAYGNNSALSYCSLSNNVAVTNGGGSYNCGLTECLLTANSAASGGGVYLGGVNYSTIVGNHATVAAGGIYNATASGCVIYDNSAPTGSNYLSSYGITYSCINPAPPSATGDITNDPAFVDFAAGNFRLQTNSPCINAGSGSPGMYDLDGRPRIVGGRIDIGAYEFQGPGIGEFTAWLQQHGLATDGSADYADTDGDGMNNWQEWAAGTDPTSSASVLKMMAPVVASDPSNITLAWQSVSNRTYFLQRSADLSAQPAFSTIESNIVGQTGVTSYTDTNAAGNGSVFYRVGIQ